MGIRNGTWWLASKKDPRWNKSGKALVGGLMMPEACKQALEALKVQLGEPPDDLEHGYMKD